MLLNHFHFSYSYSLVLLPEEEACGGADYTSASHNFKQPINECEIPSVPSAIPHCCLGVFAVGVGSLMCGCLFHGNISFLDRHKSSLIGFCQM